MDRKQDFSNPMLRWTGIQEKDKPSMERIEEKEAEVEDSFTVNGINVVQLASDNFHLPEAVGDHKAQRSRPGTAASAHPLIHDHTLAIYTQSPDSQLSFSSLTSSFTVSNQSYTSRTALLSNLPPSRRSSPRLTAVLGQRRFGAMRNLVANEPKVDMCTDPIWLLGVKHAGYVPSYSTSSRVHDSLATSTAEQRGSPDYPPIRSGPQINVIWPPEFYADFTSRLHLTYRSQFPVVRDGSLEGLSATDITSAIGLYRDFSPVTTKGKWPWDPKKELTSDAGWGCMLRTAQSLLANALIHVRLGRDWRKRAVPAESEDYFSYLKIITLFLDTPGPEAPFSIHRMALAGKTLGKEIGQWFGPSSAAGAIKVLAEAYTEVGIGVSVATDGILFRSDVFSASHGGLPYSQSLKMAWGHQPVLLLIALRLGLVMVNPVYYETVKMLFTFPHSVGVASGRPGASKYLVGNQANYLFYSDPHRVQPAIPCRSSSESPSDIESEELKNAYGHTVHRYSTAELETFHCARVRKIPVASLDPSMLLGFVCKDEEDWKDFQVRVRGLSKPVFSVRDKPLSCLESDESVGTKTIWKEMALDVTREFDEESDLSFGDESTTGHAGSLNGHYSDDTNDAKVDERSSSSLSLVVNLGT